MDINFTFNNPVKIFFGRNAIQEVASALQETAHKKILFVYGGNSLKANGSYDKIARPLHAAGFQIIDYGGVKGSVYKDVLKGIQFAKESGVDAVVAAGGSTCMDMGKLIAFGAKHDDILPFLTGEKKAQEGDMLTTVTVPTFPAGGSEVGGASGTEELPNGQRGTLSDVHAQYACLNPELTYSLNRELTLYAAFVSFCQVSTPYLGGRNAITDGHISATLKAIWTGMQQALEVPTNYEARGYQMWASCLTTLGILTCGKDRSWAYSFYLDAKIMRDLMPLQYRESLPLMFPRWLKAISKTHADDVYRYMTDIIGVDRALPIVEAIDAGCSKMLSELRKYSMPIYFDSYGEVPTEEVLRARIAVAPHTDLPIDDLLKMFQSCFLNTSK